MIRGIERVVNQQELEVGCFYLDPGYGRGSTLFQWVRSGEVSEGDPTELALVFSSEHRELLAFQDITSGAPLLLLPSVSVRVDPPSANGTSRGVSLSAGDFVVEGSSPIVLARTGYRGWVPINVETGRPVKLGINWVRISRWSLVVDEAGEEVPIASFGEAPESAL